MDPRADTQTSAFAFIQCLPPDQKLSLGLYYLGVLAGGGGSIGSVGAGYAGAAALRLETTHVGGARPSIAYLVYAAVLGDGGQGEFWWDSSETGADDGINLIRAVDVPFPSPGAWRRLS